MKLRAMGKINKYSYSLTKLTCDLFHRCAYLYPGKKQTFVLRSVIDFEYADLTRVGCRGVKGKVCDRGRILSSV